MAEEKNRYRALLIIGLFVVATVSAGYIGYWWGTHAGHPGSKEVLSPQPHWITYTDSKLGFSLMYPANWSSGITKGGYLIFYGPADDKGHNPNIIVQAIFPPALGGSYSSIDDAASDILDQLKSHENYTLISYQQTRVCNESAREIVCSYSYGGIKIKQSQVFVQDPNTGYIYTILYMATEVNYPKYRQAFEKVRETFKLPE